MDAVNTYLSILHVSLNSILIKKMYILHIGNERLYYLFINVSDMDIF